MTDPTARSYIARLRLLHPGHSEEWYAAWLRRAVHYLNCGDMADAPDLPEEAS